MCNPTKTIKPRPSKNDIYLIVQTRDKAWRVRYISETDHVIGIWPKPKRLTDFDVWSHAWNGEE